MTKQFTYVIEHNGVFLVLVTDEDGNKNDITNYCIAECDFRENADMISTCINTANLSHFLRVSTDF